MTSSSSCNDSSECVGELTCIDNRCMCNPLWAHTGNDCLGLRWNSWALVIALSLISVFSVSMLASEANKLSSAPSKCGSGVTQLLNMLCRPKRADAGSTTIRVILVSVVFDIISYLWKMLAALSLSFESTFDHWEARIFFPLAEGLKVLPTAIVVSVWVDVANSTMSRTKSKKKLEKTKRVLQFGTCFYIALLLLLCMFGRKQLAAIVQMGATVIGLCACGSGATKLCATLRGLGPSSVSTADKVFKVSRSMGICLYAMFGAEVLLLSSHTRKSDPANLALTGMIGYAVTKCFLNKSIFTYMIESAASKDVRARQRKDRSHQRLSPASAGSRERSTILSNRPGAATITTGDAVRKNETKQQDDGDWATPGPSVTSPPRPLSGHPRKVAVES